MKKFLSILVVSAFLFAPHITFAATEGAELPEQYWPHKGLTGRFDKVAVRHGFEVYKNICSACHSMNFVSYRNLKELGYSDDEVKAFAAEKTVTDGPNDNGDMFQRKALPSDHFVSPFANEKAARAVNNGALPPDLSLIVKARNGGEDYIFALLAEGYKDAPAGFTLMSGLNYNEYFLGNQIAMFQPLSDGSVTYADGTSPQKAQAAKDVVQFLAWAADPQMEARKRMGWAVIFFLSAFAGVMYALKRKIWSRLK